jgi:hypothetical protein
MKVMFRTINTVHCENHVVWGKMHSYVMLTGGEGWSLKLHQTTVIEIPLAEMESQLAASSCRTLLD